MVPRYLGLGPYRIVLPLDLILSTLTSILLSPIISQQKKVQKASVINSGHVKIS